MIDTKPGARSPGFFVHHFINSPILLYITILFLQTYMHTAPALDAQHISKVYTQGKLKALDDVSLTIQQGDFYGLLGPNGAGKTTLISILTSLLLKDSGTVKICGYDLDRDPVHAKNRVGIVPQEFNFGIFEKVENIIYNQAGYHGLTRAQVKDRVEETLKRLGLWEKRHAQGRTLSGGMKRRLMIARALVNDPAILILDEPTAGVDIELRRDMWEYLRELNKKGLTILLTTHYLEEAEELCNNLAIINKGQIIQSGRKHDLLKQMQFRSVLVDFSEPLSEQMLTHFQEFKPVREDSNTLALTLSGTHTASDIFKVAHTHHLTISDVRSKGNRLEELFLHLIKS